MVEILETKMTDNELRLKAAEMLRLPVKKPPHPNYKHLVGGEGIYYSDADLAEMLRELMMKELGCRKAYCDQLDKMWKEMRKTHKILSYRTWREFHCTPIQRIEAALQALEE